MSHAPHHHAGDDDEAVLAELLDLDAEVLQAYLSAAVERVHELAADRPVRRILDLGSGTGSGAFALARRFPGAEVIAVDQSAGMLARLRSKAADSGLADRVQTMEADLDGAWPVIEAVDLTWSSMALHHLADPGRGLAEIFAVLRPGGLLAVAEMTTWLRFLPDDIGLGRPGLEARCDAALDELRGAELPYLGADWGPLLTGAGFTGVDRAGLRSWPGPRRCRQPPAVTRSDPCAAPAAASTARSTPTTWPPSTRSPPRTDRTASCTARTWSSAAREPSGPAPDPDELQCPRGRVAPSHHPDTLRHRILIFSRRRQT